MQGHTSSQRGYARLKHQGAQVTQQLGEGEAASREEPAWRQNQCPPIQTSKFVLPALELRWTRHITYGVAVC